MFSMFSPVSPDPTHTALFDLLSSEENSTLKVNLVTSDSNAPIESLFLDFSRQKSITTSGYSVLHLTWCTGYDIVIISTGLFLCAYL